MEVSIVGRLSLVVGAYTLVFEFDLSAGRFVARRHAREQTSIRSRNVWPTLIESCPLLLSRWHLETATQRADPVPSSILHDHGQTVGVEDGPCGRHMPSTGVVTHDPCSCAAVDGRFRRSYSKDTIVMVQRTRVSYHPSVLDP